MCESDTPGVCYIKALKCSRMQTFCTLVGPCTLGWSSGGVPGSGWAQPQTSKLEAPALPCTDGLHSVLVCTHTSFNFAMAFLWMERLVWCQTYCFLPTWALPTLQDCLFPSFPMEMLTFCPTEAPKHWKVYLFTAVIQNPTRSNLRESGIAWLVV